ncbi:uncharacterized protein LOC124259204 [Haliotis rubra]|uniref:uncharacterized protein LOC124259204 n=1 Tax=Haliotis rubra TaxID=36100 RepID=UPI001EE511DC|nr:uncharacterized protein LOC124259204 [Haliotis rubra]
MTRSHVLLLVVGFVPVAAGLFCDVCKTNYDKFINVLTADEDRCAASRVYIQCLVSATGTGCDTRPDKLKVAKDEMDRIHSNGATPCLLTDSCRCELEYYSSDLNRQLVACYSSVLQNECAVNATQLGCDGVKTNEAFIELTRQKWMDVCGGQDSSKTLTPMIIITAAAFAGILGEQ